MAEKNSYITDFSDIPYERVMTERALYPFGSLNYLTGGMELGEISVIAGETGSGKTTFVSQCVGAIIREDKVMCVYGESTMIKQAQAQYRQMTPYSAENYEYVSYYKNGHKTNVGQYFVSEAAEKRIKDITRKKLFYYDPRHGMTMPQIMQAIEVSNTKGGIKYFLIDNIMQIETATENEVKEIKDSIEQLRRFVIDSNIHCILVAHYRKAQDYSQIRRRLEEICGTSAIGNKAATAMNIIRLDNVIKDGKGYRYLSELCASNGYDIQQADSVIEVLKTRHNKLGFVCLKYNRKSNTYEECEKSEGYNQEDTESLKSTSKNDLISRGTVDLDIFDVPDRSGLCKGQK